MFMLFMLFMLVAVCCFLISQGNIQIDMQVLGSISVRCPELVGTVYSTCGIITEERASLEVFIFALKYHA